jgi:hypothetical protein
MLKPIALLVVACTASATAALTPVTTPAMAETMVRHAGEWETIIDNGKPLIMCFPTDAVVGPNYILRSMAKLPNAHCTMNNWTTTGNVTSYSLQCTIGGGVMTTSGTMTVTGPDALSGKSHTHGGAIKMPNGQTMTIPDMDMTTVSRRLGPCKPGDRQAPTMH